MPTCRAQADLVPAIDALPVRVHRAGLHRCNAHWSLTPARTRAWPDLDLWVLIDGAGRVDTPGGSVDLRPGACLLLRGGEDYTFHQRPTARFVHYWVHFDYLHPDGTVATPASLRLPATHRHLSAVMTLHAMLDRVIEAQGQQGDRSRGDRWMNAALMEIARAEELDARARAGDRDCPAAVRDLHDRILRTPAERIDVGEAARRAGLSRGGFHRTFVRHFGIAPRQLMVAARMAAARELLLESDHAVGDVARATGYDDVFFFSRHFKRHHGLSPAHFRRRSIAG